jgi:barstar (barnase inhibitor)
LAAVCGQPQLEGVSSMVRIDADRIVDRASFHSVFGEAFGFPDFYGRNMDAWIDCMTHLDDPGAELSKVCIELGEVLSWLSTTRLVSKRAVPSCSQTLWNAQRSSIGVASNADNRRYWPWRCMREPQRRRPGLVLGLRFA